MMPIQDAQHFFSPLDIHFARLMQSLADRPDDAVELAAALVSRVTGNGAVCLHLEKVAGKPLSALDDSGQKMDCPDLEPWLAALKGSSMVGKPGDYRPLILDDSNRLYLLRYFQYEQNLAAAIKRLAQNHFELNGTARLKPLLNLFFGDDPTARSAGQVRALLATLLKGFTLVTGGPGTGKTYTIARMIAALMLLEEIPSERILLAAPTGKAAARLTQAMASARQGFASHPLLSQTLPVRAVTIHRLLKARADGSVFLHNARNPLSADVVVVDEASMVDMALMTRLVEAIPEGARLIMAGDKDQLVSVDSGSVLGDICHDAHIHQFSKDFQAIAEEYIASDSILKEGSVTCDDDPAKSLQDTVVVLSEGHRFGSRSGIDLLRREIKGGNVEKTMAILENKTSGQPAWDRHWPSEQSLKRLKEDLLTGYRPYLQSDDPLCALQRFMAFQVLCATNFGAGGVFNINGLAESVLMRAGLIRMGPSPWYGGRPVMITRNDHRQELYNGDIGITLPAKGANSGLQVFFPDDQGGVRAFQPHRLPEHQTVFAMTVHKSQGSEFDQVMLMLPGKDLPVLTRELIYTGLTRAKKGLKLWARPEILSAATTRRIERASGLQQRLWNDE